MPEIMNEETWIASRTDNPDRLGKELWKKEYEHAEAKSKGECSASNPKDSNPLEIRIEMLKEYIKKHNFICDLDEDDQRAMVDVFFWSLSQPEYTDKGVQETINVCAETSKKIKERLSMEDILKQSSASKKDTPKCQKAVKLPGRIGAER